MTTWTYGGSALTSFGRVTVLDDYLDIPERRGENQLLPFRHGTRFVEKYYDERHIVIGLAINVASATLLESTLDTLKKLVSLRTQQTLSQTREDASIRTIQATVDSPLQIDRKSAIMALAVLDFACSVPYFRSNTQTNGTVTINAGTVAGTVVNNGTVEEIDPTITLIGPLNNLSMTNAANGYSLSYAGSIGGTVIIQTNGTTGEIVATAGTTNVIGNITHSGGAAIMQLNAGSNPFTFINSGGTTGKVIFSFYPPYL